MSGSSIDDTKVAGPFTSDRSEADAAQPPPAAQADGGRSSISRAVRRSPLAPLVVAFVVVMIIAGLFSPAQAALVDIVYFAIPLGIGIVLWLVLTWRVAHPHVTEWQAQGVHISAWVFFVFGLILTGIILAFAAIKTWG